jgi:hypothetical protein
VSSDAITDLERKTPIHAGIQLPHAITLVIETYDCLHFAKDASDLFQAAPGWLMPARFPASYRRGVHTQSLRQFLLGEPEGFAGSSELLWQRPACWDRAVSQESDDFGNVTDERSGFVAFPVADGQGVYANILCNPFLEEAEV